jgi:hypothetical protein
MLHLVSRMVMAHVTNSHLPHMRAFRAARSAECVFNVAGRVGCRRRLNLNGIFSSVRLDCYHSRARLLGVAGNFVCGRNAQGAFDHDVGGGGKNLLAAREDRRGTFPEDAAQTRLLPFQQCRHTPLNHSLTLSPRNTK